MAQTTNILGVNLPAGFSITSERNVETGETVHTLKHVWDGRAEAFSSPNVEEIMAQLDKWFHPGTSTSSDTLPPPYPPPSIGTTYAESKKKAKPHRLKK